MPASFPAVRGEPQPEQQLEPEHGAVGHEVVATWALLMVARFHIAVAPYLVRAGRLDLLLAAWPGAERVRARLSVHWQQAHWLRLRQQGWPSREALAGV